MTGPYRPELAQLLGQSLEHYASVTAHPAQGDPFPLAVEEGGLSVTFSEDWSPHIQASVRAVTPAAVELLDALDPRQRCRLQVHAGYVLPDRSPDVHLLADVGLAERSTARPDNTVDLTAVSDEYRAQSRLGRNTLQELGSIGITEAVEFFAGWSMQPEVPTVVSDFPAGHKASLVDGTEWEAGVSHWDVMEDLAGATDTWVHVDGDRTWRVRRRPTKGGTPVHRLATGPGGNLVRTTSALAREGWANDVVLRYRWKNGDAEQDTIGRATVSSGPLAPSAAGWATYYEGRSTRTTQAKANAAARTLVSQLATRGRTLTLTALAAYWVRPGDTITVQLPTGQAEDHLVRSVTFRPVEGLMDVVTRQPLDLDITTGE